MVSGDYFRQLLDYDRWANHEAIESLKYAGGEAEHGRKLLGHIIGAQRAWLGRFGLPGQPPFEVWPNLTLEEASQAVDELHERWLGLVGKFSSEQLTEDLRYRNTKGVEFRTPIRDVLTQVIIHGAYHRGQIAAAVRLADSQPAATDYVVYVRKTKQES
jgi:uncharacterized damage-inducible protein DinB